MQAILNSLTGAGFLIDEDRASVIRVDAGEAAVTRFGELPILLGEARNIDLVSVGSAAEAVQALERNHLRQEGLDLTLILLDPDLSETTRAEAAVLLDERLLDWDLRSWVEGVLFGAPLPAGADLDGAVRLARDLGGIALPAMLSTLADRQPVIQRVHWAWISACARVLSTSEARSEATVLAARSGFFRDLVQASDGDDPGEIQSVALRTLHPLANHRELLQELARELFRHPNNLRPSEDARGLEDDRTVGAHRLFDRPSTFKDGKAHEHTVSSGKRDRNHGRGGGDRTVSGSETGFQHLQPTIEKAMDTKEELNGLAAECDRVAQVVKQEPLAGMIERFDKAFARIAEASANSWIGYQSRVYYRGFQRPAPDDYFSQEWGFTSVFAQPVSANWTEVSYDQVHEEIMRLAGRPKSGLLEDAGNRALEVFEENRDELVNILTVLLDQTRSATFEELRAEVRKLKCYSEAEIIEGLKPAQFMTRDYTAAEQGMMPPHHVRVVAWFSALLFPFQNLGELAKIARRAASFWARQQKGVSSSRQPSTHCVFIGHGRDGQWREVADFISNRLKLPVEEFNRFSGAGMTTKERLEQMLLKATFAFLLMTAEDEHADTTKHARENVIHEIGLFQQRLGFRRAIVLLEDGCREFSNIAGIVQIHFPKGFVKGTFEEIRLVLEREAILSAN